MIEQLRREIQEWREQINDWNEEIAEKRGEIEQLEEQIEDIDGFINDAYVTISEKEAEIEELESEAQRVTLIEQLTSALNEMNVEQLSNLVASLQDGETPTIQPAPETTNPTVLVVNDGNEEEYELTEEMRNSFLTIVGTSHQRAWFAHDNFVPEIGDLIELSKESDTSNCYARLSGSAATAYPELGEDITVGILPTDGSDKTVELANLGLPCKTHQYMWNHREDLNAIYTITGVVPGKFITVKPWTLPTETVENEVEETVAEAVSQLESVRHRLRHNAFTLDEARSVFNDEMPDHCRINNIVETDDAFIINYENHRANTTAEYYQTVEVERAE